MKEDIMLNPNCSEVCWRLDLSKAVPIKEQILISLNPKDRGDPEDEDYMDYDDSWGEGGSIEDLFDNLEASFKDAKKEHNADISKIELEYTDDGGGGGDYYAVDLCVEAVKKHLAGKGDKKKMIGEIAKERGYDG